MPSFRYIRSPGTFIGSKGLPFLRDLSVFGCLLPPVGLEKGPLLQPAGSMKYFCFFLGFEDLCSVESG